MTTHDAARQLGKAYVGALNTGPEEFAARFAAGAAVRLDGREADPAAVRAATPPGRSAFRGARVVGEDGEVVWTVRVRDRQGVDDREHWVTLDAEGLITALLA